MTPQRIRNIGLYYLKRFESSVENLRRVLRRRVNDYAAQTPEFNKQEAYNWIENTLTDFQKLNYLNDSRYAKLKIESYLTAGKPARYIKIKLQQKGLSGEEIDQLLDQENYDPRQMAMALAQKKKIGPFRQNKEMQKDCRQKDLATLIRAGFDYDIACDIINCADPLQDTDF